MYKRQTVGKISSDLLNKTPETRDPIEIQREMQKDYVDNLIMAVNHALKKIDCSHLHTNSPCEYDKNSFPGDFFVVVITKKEPLMQNVIRNYFIARSTCPIPDYDQAVYKYHADKEIIEFIWVIPSKDACLIMKDNAVEVHKDEKQLLQFVLDFADGTLYKKCKLLNGEKVDSIVLNKD